MRKDFVMDFYAKGGGGSRSIQIQGTEGPGTSSFKTCQGDQFKQIMRLGRRKGVDWTKLLG